MEKLEIHAKNASDGTIKMRPNRNKAIKINLN